jgi:hypothetical protein
MGFAVALIRSTCPAAQLTGTKNPRLCPELRGILSGSEKKCVPTCNTAPDHLSLPDAKPATDRNRPATSGKAINAAFLKVIVQSFIVHLVRHALNICGWKDYKAMAADLLRFYRATTANLAADELDVP